MWNSQGRRRSERLRRKQKQESQEAIRQATSRLTSLPASAAREGATPLVDVIGDENPNAVKRRFKVGWRVLSFLISGILSYALFIAWNSPEYRVSSVQVTGLQRIAPEEVLAQLNLTGLHIFAVVPEEIQGALAKRFPEFRDIHVVVNLPAQVDVKITERLPQIAWQIKNGLVWIDSEGFLIPARGAAGEMLTIQADSLPTYHLKSPIEEPGTLKLVRDKSELKPNPSAMAFFAQPKQIDGGLLTAILQLNAWMPQEKSLLYQRQRGIGWVDARGWDVFIGQKLEKINEKMVMYETIVRELEKQGISPTLVSVEFLHAPYYRTD
jgi:hypothetical protein